MSQLTVYKDSNPHSWLAQTSDFDEIVAMLAEQGIAFKRWHLEHPLDPQADNATILSVYKAEIDQLVREKGYQSHDVVSMNPDHPQKAEFRKKFLAEHIHTEDEVRFFVRGRGLFVIHAKGRVFSMLCEKDDFISVPANTTHWFDMGPNPCFTAIRLFNNPDGWVAQFTGDDIAARFPKFEG